MADANVLHHANRDHAVELPGELTIVQLTKFDVIGHTGGLSMVACHLNLLG